MQQHIPGQRPVCHPHLTRRNLLVKDSKIFVPILAAVPEHHEDTVHKFWHDCNSSDVKELTSDSVLCVYYCRTYYKAVRVGEEDSGGHVL